MSSLMTCSGQGVVIQGKETKKSVWSRILGINPHTHEWVMGNCLVISGLGSRVVD